MKVTDAVELKYLEDGDFELSITWFREYADDYLTFEDIELMYNYARKETGKSSDAAKSVDEDRDGVDFS